MLVVLSFFSGDKEQAVRLAEWIEELGDCKEHDIILAVNRDTTSDGVIEPLTRAFRRVAEFPITDPMNNSREMYQYCANLQWKRSANLIPTLEDAGPWLFLEPDVAPTQPGWLDAIAAEYKAGGRPFMLDVVQWMGSTHPSGVGVYPARVCDYTHRMHELGNEPWDVFFREDFLPHNHRGKCIQDNAAMKPDPDFSRPEAMSIIRPETRLFHRDKTGELIQRLREARGGVKATRPAIISRETSGAIQVPATDLRTIYTYNEDIGGEFADPELLAMSIDSFRRNGFNMVVLNETDAMRHPLYEKLSTHPNLYEGGNVTPYLRACYRRWMALSVQSKGDIKHQPVMVDWDVINYGFTPDMLPPATGTMKMLNVMAVPGMMIGTCDAYETMVQAFSHYADNPVPLAKKTIHDQNIVELRSDLWTGVKLMVEYPSDGWETAKLVHYPHGRLYFPGHRGAKIKKLRPLDKLGVLMKTPDGYVNSLLTRIAALEAQLSGVPASVPAKSGNGVLVPSLTPPRRTPPKPKRRIDARTPERKRADAERMAALRARKAA